MGAFEVVTDWRVSKLIAADSDTVRTWGLEHGVPDPRSASLFREANELWLGPEAGLAHFALRRTRKSAG